MIGEVEQNEAIRFNGEKRLILEVIYQAAKDVNNKKPYYISKNDYEFIKADAYAWLQEYSWPFINLIGVPISKKAFNEWADSGFKIPGRKKR